MILCTIFMKLLSSFNMKSQYQLFSSILSIIFSYNFFSSPNIFNTVEIRTDRRSVPSTILYLESCWNLKWITFLQHVYPLILFFIFMDDLITCLDLSIENPFFSIFSSCNFPFIVLEIFSIWLRSGLKEGQCSEPDCTWNLAETCIPL